MLTRLIMAQKVQSVRWAFNCRSWSPSESEWQFMASGLDNEDKEQVGKFVFQKDAKSAMVGRFLVKKFVSEATGLLWRDISILRDSEHRKPYFPLDSKINFNISHSGDFVVLAGEVGNLNLGVDMMKIEKQRTTSVPEFFRLMSSQFAPEEWAVVKSQKSEPEQMAMFYRFWCLKESYTKATGTGITVDLQKICFKLNNLCLSEETVINDTEVYVNGSKQTGWTFEESLINSNHVVAVARNYTSEVFNFALGNCNRLFQVLAVSDILSRYQQVTDPDEEYGKQFDKKQLKP